MNNTMHSFRKLLSDRAYSAALIVQGIIVLVIIIAGIVYIRPDEIKLPTSFSNYDERQYILGSWYYSINFLLFAVIVAVLHLMISAKLYHRNGRQVAIAYVYLGAIILMISLIFVLAIFKAVALSQ